MALMTPTIPVAIAKNRESMTIRLTDGRTLGYAEYGDPSGKPVLFFHGATLSRLFGAAADASARRIGVRLIAPDRPGIGLSDPEPGRTMLDWAADVGELADRLDLARFSVLGHSLGGAYVLACAYAMPKRLIGAGVAAGAIPVGPKGELPPLLRMSPTLVAILLSTMTRLLMFGPQWLRQKMRAADPPSDRELFASPEFAAIVERSVLEGLRRGVRGIRTDAAVLAKPWGFDFEDLQVPVHLWYAELDSMVPFALGKKLAAAIPQSVSRFSSAQGHMSVLVDNLDQILSTLSSNNGEAKGSLAPVTAS
jgi:pimeloyl-ACP methyl ester carboxylesterase